MSQYGSYQYASPPPVQQSGMPKWAKWLIILGILFATIIILSCAGLMWLGFVTPPLEAMPGSQMRARDLDVVHDHGLIDVDEPIKYFYSDGLLNVKEGMYFFTEKRLIIYSETMDPDEPLMELTWPEIIDITIEYDDSFLYDSTIWVETETEFVPFPVSSDMGGDRKFFELLVDTWERHRDN